MDDYRRALGAYFEPKERTQEALANRIGRSQAAVNRYVNGERFPDADTARKIEEATEGAVPFDLWQRITMDRLGMGVAA
jgi:transcriptional regulator with XRE-family HTH domain